MFHDEFQLGSFSLSVGYGLFLQYLSLLFLLEDILQVHESHLIVTPFHRVLNFEGRAVNKPDFSLEVRQLTEPQVDIIEIGGLVEERIHFGDGVGQLGHLLFVVGVEFDAD